MEKSIIHIGLLICIKKQNSHINLLYLSCFQGNLGIFMFINRHKT